jgi:hypothetical protein
MIVAYFPHQTNRETRSPNSVKLPSQPQPASMSATSQYYRSVNNHSLYQTYPSSDHEQLYVTTWQQDTKPPLCEGPPAPFLLYTQGGEDSISHLTSPLQGWPAGDVRQNSNLECNQPFQTQSIVPQLLNSCGSVVGPTSVPHQNHETSQQYHQHVSATRQDLSLSQPAPTYQDDERCNPAIASTVFIPRGLGAAKLGTLVVD